MKKLVEVATGSLAGNRGWETRILGENWVGIKNLERGIYGGIAQDSWNVRDLNQVG